MQDEVTVGRTPFESMRAGIRRAKQEPPPGETPSPFSRLSERRTDEERERRHRERAIASWLRSLSR